MSNNDRPKKDKKDKKESEGKNDNSVQMGELARQQPVIMQDGASQWSPQEKRIYVEYINKAQIGISLCQREQKQHKRINLILAICSLLLPYIITVLNVSGLSAKIEDNKDLVTSIFSISIILSVFESIVIAVDKLYEPSVQAIHYRQVTDRLTQYKNQLQVLLANKKVSEVHPYSNPVSLSQEFSNIMSSAEEIIGEVEQKERRKRGEDDEED